MTTTTEPTVQKSVIVRTDVSHAFQTFTQSYVISSGTGGPVNSTLVYTLYMYQQAFGNFKMGYASAMAWLLVIVIGVLTAIAFGTSKHWVHYAGDK